MIIANFYMQDFRSRATRRSSAFITTRRRGRHSLRRQRFSGAAGADWAGDFHSQSRRTTFAPRIWAGRATGTSGRINVNHAFYEALGTDSFNPIAGAPSRSTRRWPPRKVPSTRIGCATRSPRSTRPDCESARRAARGFDTIEDFPAFAGGIFSFWNREGIRLTGTGVNLTSPDSLLPSLRTNKNEGQANFVNPGIFLVNPGADFDLTPKLQGFLNVNYLRFERTAPLELLLFESPIHNTIGLDSSLGFQYRPPLSENISITAAPRRLCPGKDFATFIRAGSVFAFCGRSVSVLARGETDEVLKRPITTAMPGPVAALLCAASRCLRFS